MFNQAYSTAIMEKSIFTPEQDALQRVLRQIRLGAGLRQEDLAERLNALGAQITVLHDA